MWCEKKGGQDCGEHTYEFCRKITKEAKGSKVISCKQSKERGKRLKHVHIIIQTDLFNGEGGVVN
jgi:hypothetical protein